VAQYVLTPPHRTPIPTPAHSYLMHPPPPISYVLQAPDVNAPLHQLGLSPALTSCCGAVVALAQDCEDNQAAFTRHPDFTPALFRLLGVDDPAVAAQAARWVVCVCVGGGFTLVKCLSVCHGTCFDFRPARFMLLGVDDLAVAAHAAAWVMCGASLPPSITISCGVLPHA
jgi:hypothetical protein